MLIGPIVNTSSKDMYAVLCNIGPGENQGLVWNGSVNEWQTVFYDMQGQALELVLTGSSGSAWSMASLDAPEPIPANQAMRAMIFEQAGAEPDFLNDTYIKTVDVGSFVAPVIGEQRHVGEAFKWRLGRRSDGTTIAVNALAVRPGEVIAAAFDARWLLPGASIVAMTQPVVEGGDGIIARKIGDSSVLGSLAKMTIEAITADDGDQFEVSSTIAMENGDEIAASGRITCRS